jgi:hypothetical protein
MPQTDGKETPFSPGRHDCGRRDCGRSFRASARSIIARSAPHFAFCTSHFALFISRRMQSEKPPRSSAPKTSPSLNSVAAWPRNTVAAASPPLILPQSGVPAASVAAAAPASKSLRIARGLAASIVLVPRPSCSSSLRRFRGLPATARLSNPTPSPRSHTYARAAERGNSR